MDLDRIYSFIKIVELGSFTKAAKTLGRPTSWISRQLKVLENDIGSQLIIRTTRNLSLTETGYSFFKNCQKSIKDIEKIYSQVLDEDPIKRKKIRLTAPVDIGVMLLAPILNTFLKQNPQVDLEIEYTDKIVDLVKENYDIALRVGDFHSKTLKYKKLGKVSHILVSRSYNKNAIANIKKPMDLLKHKLLYFGSPTPSPSWTLLKGRSSKTISIEPFIQCNYAGSLLVF